MSENIVKKVCKELGLTYRELGEKIGYSENAISNAARGKISEPMQKAIKLYIENIKLKKEIENNNKYINCVTDIILSTKNFIIIVYEPNKEYAIKKEDITGIRTYNLNRDFIIEIYLKEHHNHEYVIAFKYNDYETGKTAYSRIKEVL